MQVEVKKSDYKQEVQNRQITLNNATSGGPKLFVGGLKEHHDEQALRNYFSQFGQVLSVNVLADKTTGLRRGFAYVEFDGDYAIERTLGKSH